MLNKNVRTIFKYYLAPLLCITIICIWAYFPGLQGGYYFDDDANIKENTLLHIESLHPSALWQAMWSGQASHLKRPIPMLSFAMNYYFFGLDPGAMKIVNLLIHILNGFVLIFLLRILLKNTAEKFKKPKLLAITSLAITAFWLLHPINLTSVLYVVQRMTSLGALFSILSILCYSIGRQAQLKSPGNWTPILIGCPLFSLLALLSKENAILIPYYILCIELFIFKFNADSSNARNIIKTLIILATATPIIFFITYFSINPETLSTWYAPRNFTLSERLLTEARILVWYIKMIIMPNISSMGLLIDEFDLSKSLFQPLTTFGSLAFIASLFSAIYFFRNKLPLFSFGIAWFFAGHLLESTFIPLELVFEHRNYLPSIGIIIAVFSLLNYCFRYIQKYKALRIALPALWLITFAVATHGRAEHWESPITLALFDVENHPTSSRTNVMAGLVYLQAAVNSESDRDKHAYAEQADIYFLNAIELDKRGLSSSIGRIVSLYLLNKPIEKKFFNGIVQNLKTKNVGPSTQNSLLSLIDCQIEKVCRLPEESLTALLESAHSNPYLTPKDKGSLLVAFAEYHVKILGDLDKAEELIIEAIEIDKNTIRYRLVLANWQILNGKFVEAQNQLDILKELDTLNANAYDISKWEEFLNKMKMKNS